MANWVPSGVRPVLSPGGGASGGTAASALMGITEAVRMASESRLLGGVRKLHTLDLSACGAVGLQASDLAALLACLPLLHRGRATAEAEAGGDVGGGRWGGVHVLLPAWCLRWGPQGSPSSFAAAAGSSAGQWRCLAPEAEPLLAAVRPLAAVVAASSSHQPQGKGNGRSGGGGRLQLLGPGLLLRCDAQLRQTCQLGPALTQLHLLDCYTYRGSLSWGLLAGLAGLRLLAVTPSTQESMTKVSYLPLPQSLPPFIGGEGNAWA